VQVFLFSCYNETVIRLKRKKRLPRGNGVYTRDKKIIGMKMDFSLSISLSLAHTLCLDISTLPRNYKYLFIFVVVEIGEKESASRIFFFKILNGGNTYRLMPLRSRFFMTWGGGGGRNNFRQASEGLSPTTATLKVE
jgi:hypothetical protein